jgi:predicted GIY-YIG superfamily endonuclease
VRSYDTTPDEATTPTEWTVYRCYNAEGVLLYVGVTDDIRQRITHHRTNAPWFGGVSRLGCEVYTERDAAYAREGALIREALPPGNRLITGVGRRSRDRGLVPVHAALTPPMHSWLRARAEAEGCSVTEALVRALESVWQVESGYTAPRSRSLMGQSRR